MNRPAAPFAAALLAGAALASAAQAGTLPDGGVTVQEVAAVLQAKGYKAAISKDNVGDPLITSAGQGTTFRILFYGCTPARRCRSITYQVAWDMKEGPPLGAVNKWNLDNRFGRAALDDENDPFLRMDEDVEHGATTEALANDLDRWDSVLGSFQKFLSDYR